MNEDFNMLSQGHSDHLSDSRAMLKSNLNEQEIIMKMYLFFIFKHYVFDLKVGK